MGCGKEFKADILSVGPLSEQMGKVCSEERAWAGWAKWWRGGWEGISEEELEMMFLGKEYQSIILVYI